MAGRSSLYSGCAVVGVGPFSLVGRRWRVQPSFVVRQQITNWDTRLKVLGWLVDTEALTVTAPAHKRLKLRLLLAEWPVTRTCDSAKQVSRLADFLMHISFAVCPGSFFVHRLLASVAMPRIAAGDQFPGQMANPGRCVALGPEFHADLDFCRWFVDRGVDARGGVLSAPMYRFLLDRPAQHTWFLDASKTAVGGYFLETGVHWRYDLTAEEQSRFCGSSKSVRGVDDLSINVPGRLGMVVSAFVLVSSCADRPSVTGDRALLRGDNEAAVHLVRRCRGGLEPRSGALTRLLGVLEVSSGWYFEATHMRGIHNAAADGISR